MIVRTVQVVLFLAIIIPFGWMVREGVATLDQRGLDLGSGVVIGMALMFGLWQWDERLRRRNRKPL